jgi:hypothetical protein
LYELSDIRGQDARDTIFLNILFMIENSCF